MIDIIIIILGIVGLLILLIFYMNYTKPRQHNKIRVIDYVNPNHILYFDKFPYEHKDKLILFGYSYYFVVYYPFRSKILGIPPELIITNERIKTSNKVS